MATLKTAAAIVGLPALTTAGLPPVLGLVVWLAVAGPTILERWYTASRYVRGLDRRRLPR